MKSACICAISGCILLLLWSILETASYGMFRFIDVSAFLEPIILLIFIVTFYKRQNLGFNDNASGEEIEAKYKSAEKNLGDNVAEKVIAIVANVVLVLGILGSLIFGFVQIHLWSTVEAAFAIIVGGTFSSIIAWAFLMVIANISNNIRQIKCELRYKNKN